MLALLLLTLAALALLAGEAAAEYQGTPGKIVYVDGGGGIASKFPLKLWDPGLATPSEPNKGIKILEEETFHYQTGPDEARSSAKPRRLSSRRTVGRLLTRRSNRTMAGPTKSSATTLQSGSPTRTAANPSRSRSPLKPSYRRRNAIHATAIRSPTTCRVGAPMATRSPSSARSKPAKSTRCIHSEESIFGRRPPKVVGRPS